MSPQRNQIAIARDVRFTRWLFWAYLVLFLMPLPLGSNRPLFWSLMVPGKTMQNQQTPTPLSIP
jgi:hypothetical protein